MNRWHCPPTALYELVERTPATVLLESARPGLAGSQPDLTDAEPQTRLFTVPLRVCLANDPAQLPSLFAEVERAVSAGLYAAGYFCYECGALFEPSTGKNPPQTPPRVEPIAWIGIYQRPYVFDHRTGSFLDGEPPALSQFRTGPHTEDPAITPPLDCTLALNEQQYVQRIGAIHDWIRCGDVYQLNFSVPMHLDVSGSSAALYRRLRSRQPAPYGAFLHTESNRRILSFSPELFFRVERDGAARRITTRPMKGTAPRGRTTGEDRALADGLSNDPKNRSENVMIVDLLRNDLGRLCAFGSVRASRLFAVERYPTLWQMTSTIQGDLRPEVGFQDIFRALFPCGSITGAPKVRAMQLIAQLEQRPRGIYTGAIGFFSQQQTIFNVAIRTLSLDGERGTMGVGSGIVIDSRPADEFRECLLKAEFLTRAFDNALQPGRSSFSLIETLLWQGEFPFVELHLDRLQDSALYFQFSFDRAAIKSALEDFAAKKLGAPSLMSLFAERVGDHPASPPQLERLQPHKVRLLLQPEGAVQITCEPISTHPSKPLRLRIAAQRTDPQDPMFFHKTTHRALYEEALQAANQAGFDEVVFLNQRGEVTEAAFHNLFIEKDGHLLTPPIDCGLLPGIKRRHILASNPNARESVLSIEDLRQADAVYLSNAVRGLRPAIIHWEII